MPGVASVSADDDNTYEVIVAAQVVVKSALFRMRAKITEDEPTRLAVKATGGEVSGDTRIDIRGQLDLTSIDDAVTRIAFALRGTVEGKMMHVGTGPAINYQSRHMARQFASDVTKHIEALGNSSG